MTDQPAPDADGDRPTRILHVVKGLEAGGAEHLLVMAARFRDRDHFAYEVAHLLPDHITRRADLIEEGVDVSCLDGTPWWDPRWMLRLRRRLGHRPVDVVHAHSPLVAAGARLVVASLPRSQRPKLVVTLHNMWRSHHLAVRAVDRLTWRADDLRLTVSEAVRRSLPPTASERAVTVIHGIDVATVRNQADRDGARVELGVGPDEVLIGTVANLRATKGYPDLLQAARVVVAREPGARFVALGEGAERARLESLRDDAELGHRFRFLGRRADAVRLVSAFDVFCLSSHHEGLPVALMEALVLGVPVVATDVGGIAELVTPGREGLLVPAHRPDLLAQHLGAVIADGDRRANLAGAAWVRGSQLDAARATGTIEDHYRRLLA